MKDSRNKNLGASGAGDFEHWPDKIREISYLSKADNTDQSAMYYSSGNSGRPLLVGLHTWSFDYTQVSYPYAQWCIDNGWVFIYPNFRGPNLTPQACGSDLAVEDIVSAVEFACQKDNIDRSRIYLAGVSGGGHMSLLMAGRKPEIWAGVSSWCPILDIPEWYYQTKKAQMGYYLHIEKVCGGQPVEGSGYYDDCIKRSPINYLENASNVKLDICAGIHDGHNGSVPISHSIDAYNILSDEKDRITKSQKKIFVNKQIVPEELCCEINNSDYGEKKALFQRESRKVRLTIFKGDHEIIYPAALNWLEKQKLEN